MLVGLAGCNQSLSPAEKVMKEFLFTKFEIPSVADSFNMDEKVKPFMTEKGLKKFKEKKEGFLITFAMFNMKGEEMKVEDYTIRTVKDEGKVKKIEYEISVSLKDQYGDVHKFKKKGKASIVQQGDKWLIDDHDNERAKIGETLFEM